MSSLLLGVIQSSGGGGVERSYSITGVNTDVVLLDMHTALYGAPVSGDHTTFTVEVGATVRSSGPSVPSMDTGTWPAGSSWSVVNLEFTRWRGAGADGTGPSAGGRGGTAFKARTAGTLNNTLGALRGGGGAGAGTDIWTNGLGQTYKAGGGGGAGDRPGLGFVVTGSDNNQSGHDGTTTLRGLGGHFGSDPSQPTSPHVQGGDGGNQGSDGTSASDVYLTGSTDNTGGPAGYAIDKYSLVTLVGTGTLIGPVNG